MLGAPIELVPCRLLVISSCGLARTVDVAGRLGDDHWSCPAVMCLRLIHSGAYGDSVVIGRGAVCDVPLCAQYQRKDDHQKPEIHKNVEADQPQRNRSSHFAFHNVAQFCCVVIVVTRCIHDCYFSFVVWSQSRTKRRQGVRCPRLPTRFWQKLSESLPGSKRRPGQHISPRRGVLKTSETSACHLRTVLRKVVCSGSQLITRSTLEEQPNSSKSGCLRVDSSAIANSFFHAV